MAKTNTVIEINGKRYDAKTGALLGSKHAHASIDGVVRTQKATPAPQPVSQIKKPEMPKPITNKPLMDVRPAKTSKPRPASHHATTHTPESSKILMRRAVKKPQASLKAKTRTHTRTDILARKPSVVVSPKFSFHAIDTKRLKRAEQVAQSEFVSRFGSLSLHHTLSVNLARASYSLPVKTSVAPKHTRAAQQPTMDIFERALQHATSHQQPKHPAKAQKHSRSRRITGLAPASLAVLLIAGFVAYQNVTALKVHLASSKAGFAVNLPSYHAPGFALGNFNYSPGSVAINFKSNSDDRHFQLIEHTSNWDSQTLLSDFVASTTGSYQTIENAGRTIYIYGDNNATWVANGIWYQVQSANSLSTNQLIQLASSM